MSVASHFEILYSLPTLLVCVRRDGSLVHANKVSKAEFVLENSSVDVAACLGVDRKVFLDHIKHACRTASLTPLQFEAKSKSDEKYKVMGCRARQPDADGSPVVLLAFKPKSDMLKNFTVLNEKIDHLNKEVLRRKHAEIELRRANDDLENKVEQRTVELQEKSNSLQEEVNERRKIEEKLRTVQKKATDAARHAGMAEIASQVLHNVGNVLNSLISGITVLQESVQRIPANDLETLSQFLKEYETKLCEAFDDTKIQKTPQFLEVISEALSKTQKHCSEELEIMSDQAQHIDQIISSQRDYSKNTDYYEEMSVVDVVEEALIIGVSSWSRLSIKVERQFETNPKVYISKNKFLQILVNLLSNARHAVQDAGAAVDPKVKISVREKGSGHVLIEIEDNGCGVDPSIKDKIFSNGFTTKRKGSGIGLHGSILFAKEFGGTISFRSDGPGKGSTFSLEVPVRANGERTDVA